MGRKMNPTGVWVSGWKDVCLLSLRPRVGSCSRPREVSMENPSLPGVHSLESRLRHAIDVTEAR